MSIGDIIREAHEAELTTLRARVAELEEWKSLHRDLSECPASAAERRAQEAEAGCADEAYWRKHWYQRSLEWNKSAGIIADQRDAAEQRAQKVEYAIEWARDALEQHMATTCHYPGPCRDEYPDKPHIWCGGCWAIHALAQIDKVLG